MRKKRLITLPAVFLAAVMLCGGCGEENKEQGSREQNTQESGMEQNNTEGSEGQESQPDASADEQPSESELPDPVVFEAVDLEGNQVTSDIFADSRLTMVNVWATYCNPCLSEMPELGELAEEYDSADFQLIGIISDVMEGAEQSELDNAAELIVQTEADYTHLLLNRSLYDELLYNVSAVPTTFFIDENGTLLGGVIGARDKDTWKEIIDGLLEEL